MRRLNEAQAKFAGNLVAEAKKKADLSNEAIAAEADYNERVVRDVIHARCRTYETVRKVCAALAIDLDAALHQAGLKDDDGTPSNPFGGYSKSNYGHLIGSYTTIRSAYADPANLIKCYRTMINWDAGLSALCFSEANRDDDYRQDGHIYIPPSSAFMYLMTIKNGWVRTVLISQLVATASVMRGLILSQFNSNGPHYAPVCSPIVYVRQQSEQAEISYGDIGARISDTKRTAPCSMKRYPADSSKLLCRNYQEPGAGRRKHKNQRRPLRSVWLKTAWRMPLGLGQDGKRRRGAPERSPSSLRSHSAMPKSAKECQCRVRPGYHPPTVRVDCGALFGQSPYVRFDGRLSRYVRRTARLRASKRLLGGNTQPPATRNRHA
jgi:hypothetical protein